MTQEQIQEQVIVEQSWKEQLIAILDSTIGGWGIAIVVIILTLTIMLYLLKRKK